MAISPQTTQNCVPRSCRDSLQDLARIFSWEVLNLSDNLVIISPCDIFCKCIVREKENGLFLISQFEIDSDFN